MDFVVDRSDRSSVRTLQKILCLWRASKHLSLNGIHIEKIKRHAKMYGLEQPPNAVTVTTRIIPFLVGNLYKPSFVTVTGWLFGVIWYFHSALIGFVILYWSLNKENRLTSTNGSRIWPYPTVWGPPSYKVITILITPTNHPNLFNGCNWRWFVSTATTIRLRVFLVL